MIRIVVTLDEKFVEPLAALLASIKKSHKKSVIECYVVTGGLSSMNLISLKKLSGKNFIIKFIINSTLDKVVFKIDKHASTANYYRIFLPDLLPNHIDKILYLDTDTLVLRNLSKLWNTEVNEYAIAAVPYPNQEREEALGLQEGLYFNSGVMLVNLKYWRENNISKQLSNYILANMDLIKFWDQDALNVVLSNQVKYLSNEWNFREVYGTDKFIFILHFMGFHKPWSIHYKKNNNTRLYYRHLLDTPFRKLSHLLKIL